jgi:hypothetical protein
MLSTAILSIVTSLVAAATYAFVADRIKGRRLNKRFSILKGRYHQCNLQGEEFDGRFTDITEVRRNLLTLEGDDATRNRWRGTILMDERFPSFGFGQYQYQYRPDCGRHEIQVTDGGKTIFVRVENTSHGQNPPFTLIWKREEL